MASAFFLVAEQGAPATVASSGDWQTILANENLKAVDVPEGKTSEDVSITITSAALPIIKTLNPTFSSSQNAASFGSSAQLTVNPLLNTAWLGDPSNCL